MARAGHDFVILVPVADRPLHLANCLGSLAGLLRRYPYDGRVTALIVDDSADAGNAARHREIIEGFVRDGLDVRHLDAAAQRALVAGLPAAVQAGVAGIVGRADAETFHHKGAAVTRNIAYLWLNNLPDEGRKRLFWSLDSDQEFRVNLDTPAGEVLDYAVDYLHGLDRIFSETPTRILTGKVVGDPPVSPAVMAGNFLDDVIGFLAEMAGLDPAAACTFHGEARHADDAAYHDMADLFGFRGTREAWRYRCPVEGPHDHAACFADFAGRLNRFFDGEHLTRRSYYTAQDVLASLKPARTIYTGNYVFTPAGLEWFIPFASLKLRMAGPTLGRILRASLGSAFASANLPMLHRRTVETIGQSEFRPGVERRERSVDLSGEFERQYYGDVMLFSMERLTAQGYPDGLSEVSVVKYVVEGVEAGMRQRYLARQEQTGARIETLAGFLADTAAWWRRAPALAAARSEFDRFIHDMRTNFAADSAAVRLIEANRETRMRNIQSAIAGYRADRTAWQAALGRTP